MAVGGGGKRRKSGPRAKNDGGSARKFKRRKKTTTPKKPLLVSGPETRMRKSGGTRRGMGVDVTNSKKKRRGNERSTPLPSGERDRQGGCQIVVQASNWQKTPSGEGFRLGRKMSKKSRPGRSDPERFLDTKELRPRTGGREEALKLEKKYE